MMKHFLAVAAILVSVTLLSAQGAGNEKIIQEVKQALRALNAAFEKGDATSIKKLTTDDHIAVAPYYGGTMTVKEQLSSLADLKFSEFRPGELRVTLLGVDSALVTYSLTQKGTYKGKPLAGKAYASSVLVKRDGRWLEVFYQETALDAK